MRTFIIGDIHGHLEKLQNCLDSVDFNYQEDTLIQLGDVVDRGVDVYSCVELLLTINNLIAIRGNHDNEWLTSLINNTDTVLYNQGGRETKQSYTRRQLDPKIHLKFFTNQLPYYINEDNNLFIHGGFNRHYLLEEQSEDQWYWDRDLFLSALSFKAMKNNSEQKFKIKDDFKEIFIGHTPTLYWGSTVPINAANIWNLDTGCGKGGLLTIMNLKTKEYNQF